MSAVKHTPMEPMPLGGFIDGMDFGAGQHGTISVQTDEAFRAALGKKARVLLVPDEPVYRTAPALADALEAALHEAGHACCCEKPHSTVGLALHEADCWTAKARAALRAAGRIP